MKVKSHWAISKQWIELTVDSGWKARHKITYVHPFSIASKCDPVAFTSLPSYDFSFKLGVLM